MEALKMKARLRYATLLAIIGISYLFAVRIFWTFFTGAFSGSIGLIIFDAIHIVSFLCSLAILFFFYSFHRDYVEEEQTALKKVSVLPIIGYCAILLVQLKTLVLILDIYSPSSVVTPHFIEVMIPRIVAIFILLFFVVFYREMLQREQKRLKNAILAAIVGSAIQALLLSFVFFHYLFSRKALFALEYARTMSIIFVPIFAFSFITILYFFVSFYKMQRQSG
jgi:hypothetical protein